MTKRIQKAIDIFLDAINNRTSAKGSCTACAVGNLVGAGMGIPIYVGTSLDDEKPFKMANSKWANAFSSNINGEQVVYKEKFKNLKVIRCVEATDFSIEELIKIENVFECNTKISYYEYNLYTKEEIRADQIKGLEAVVRCMLEFDDCKDIVKEVFTTKAKLIEI